jgi:hypothetical protein
MPTARCVRELIVRTENRVGLLGQVASLVSQLSIDILAVYVLVQEGEAEIHLLTDAQTYAKRALEAADLPVEERDVVAVELPNRSGFLRKITESLARQGIDIRLLFATAAPGTRNSLVILSTSNNGKAVLLLRGR